MRLLALSPLLLCVAALAGCASASPEISSAQCDEFAVSGGYPFLQGGPTFGSNSTLEQLPNAPPLWLDGAGEPSAKAHLDEEAYLRNWCLANMR